MALFGGRLAAVLVLVVVVIIVLDSCDGKHGHKKKKKKRHHNSDKELDPVCSAPVVVASCDDSDNEYYFNTATKKCTIDDDDCYSGDNSFETLGDCTTKCDPQSSPVTKPPQPLPQSGHGVDPVCMVATEKGSCSDDDTKDYSYDAVNKVCVSDVCYRGPNSFDSDDECESKCDVQPTADEADQGGKEPDAACMVATEGGYSCEDEGVSNLLHFFLLF